MKGQTKFSSSRRLRTPDFSLFFFQGLRSGARTIFFAGIFFSAGNLLAQTTNASITAPAFPEAGVSLLRVTGTLALVLGLFLAGAWFFKNWQRLALQRGARPKLNILETRSLGARQAVLVVAYERQRFLVATSPAGVNLLSHLPDVETNETEPAEKTSTPMSFGQALAQVLKRK
jgi:flagellar biogenesis protein FliO